MAWRPISADQIVNRLAPVEVSGLADAQDLTTATAKLHERIADEIEKWRGAILAAGADLGPPFTIPDQFRNYVMAIARWEWLIDFPSLKYMQTEERRQAAETGEEIFKDLLQGEIVVIESPVLGGAPVPMWNADNRIIGRMQPVPAPATQLTPVESGLANPDVDL